MNLHLQGAYGQVSAILQSPREAEYEVIARVTRELSRAKALRQNLPRKMLEALYLNDRLWSALVSDVVLEANGLPPSLKAKLIYLYRFSLHQSALIREGRGEVDVLIEINQAVMRGLRGEGGR